MNIKSNFSSHTFLQSIKEGSIDKQKAMEKSKEKERKTDRERER